MLKIKDNVDLKELEKFLFFRKKYLFNNRCYYIYKGEYYNIEISCDDRIIVFVCYDDDDLYDPDTLYDLIQAGLVEKVSD